MGFDRRYADLPGAVIGPPVDVLDAGTITLADVLPGGVDGLDVAPSRRQRREAARQEAAAELRRRQERERQGTADLVAQLKLDGLPEPRTLLHPLGQIRLVPGRRWKVDLAFEDAPLLVDLQGIGTHSSVKGLALDAEKACAAAVLGVCFMPITYKFVKDGRALAWITEAYRRLRNDPDQRLTFENGFWVRRQNP